MLAFLLALPTAQVFPNWRKCSAKQVTGAFCICTMASGIPSILNVDYPLLFRQQNNLLNHLVPAVSRVR